MQTNPIALYCDDSSVLASLTLLLNSYDMDVKGCRSAEELRLASKEYGLLVIGCFQFDIPASLLALLDMEFCTTPVIVISGHPTVHASSFMERTNIKAIIETPGDPDNLLTEIRKVLSP